MAVMGLLAYETTGVRDFSAFFDWLYLTIFRVNALNLVLAGATIKTGASPER